MTKPKKTEKKPTTPIELTFNSDPLPMHALQEAAASAPTSSPYLPSLDVLTKYSEKMRKDFEAGARPMTENEQHLLNLVTYMFLHMKKTEEQIAQIRGVTSMFTPLR